MNKPQGLFNIFLCGDFIFTAVTIGKTKYKRGINPSWYERAEIKCGALSFFRLTLRFPEAINFRRIRRLLCGQKLLLDEKCRQKIKFDYEKPKSAELERRLFKNAVSAWLSDNVKGKDIVLIDRRAKHTYLLDTILKYAPSARAATEHIGEYEEYAKRIYYEIGAAVTVGREIKKSGNTVFINPERREIEAENRIITNFKADAPQKYAELLPFGIDEADFYAALYSECGAFEIGEITPRLLGADEYEHTLNFPAKSYFA